MSAIQSVTFPSDWTEKNCQDWLYDHGFTPIKKVHLTANRRRYRIAEPEYFDHYSTKVLPEGVELVIGYL